MRAHVCMFTYTCFRRFKVAVGGHSGTVLATASSPTVRYISLWGLHLRRHDFGAVMVPDARAPGGV